MFILPKSPQNVKLSTPNSTSIAIPQINALKPIEIQTKDDIFPNKIDQVINDLTDDKNNLIKSKCENKEVNNKAITFVSPKKETEKKEVKITQLPKLPRDALNYSTEPNVDLMVLTDAISYPDTLPSTTDVKDQIYSTTVAPNKGRTKVLDYNNYEENDDIQKGNLEDEINFDLIAPVDKQIKDSTQPIKNKIGSTLETKLPREILHESLIEQQKATLQRQIVCEL